MASPYQILLETISGLVPGLDSLYTSELEQLSNNLWQAKVTFGSWVFLTSDVTVLFWKKSVHNKTQAKEVAARACLIALLKGVVGVPGVATSTKLQQVAKHALGMYAVSLLETDARNFLNQAPQYEIQPVHSPLSYWTAVAVVPEGSRAACARCMSKADAKRAAAVERYMELFVDSEALVKVDWTKVVARSGPDAEAAHVVLAPAIATSGDLPPMDPHVRVKQSSNQQLNRLTSLQVHLEERARPVGLEVASGSRAAGPLSSSRGGVVRDLSSCPRGISGIMKVAQGDPQDRAPASAAGFPGSVMDAPVEGGRAGHADLLVRSTKRVRDEGRPQDHCGHAAWTESEVEPLSEEAESGPSDCYLAKRGRTGDEP